MLFLALLRDTKARQESIAEAYLGGNSGPEDAWTYFYQLCGAKFVIEFWFSVLTLQKVNINVCVG